MFYFCFAVCSSRQHPPLMILHTPSGVTSVESQNKDSPAAVPGSAPEPSSRRAIASDDEEYTARDAEEEEEEERTAVQHKRGFALSSANIILSLFALGSPCSGLGGVLLMMTKKNLASRKNRKRSAQRPKRKRRSRHRKPASRRQAKTSRMMYACFCFSPSIPSHEGWGRIFQQRRCPCASARFGRRTSWVSAQKQEEQFWIVCTHTELHDSIISPLIASHRTGRSEEEKRKEMDRCKKFIGIHHLKHSLNIACQMFVFPICCLTREQHQRLWFRHTTMTRKLSKKGSLDLTNYWCFQTSTTSSWSISKYPLQLLFLCSPAILSLKKKKKTAKLVKEILSFRAFVMFSRNGLLPSKRSFRISHCE